ncbi:MAG: hypothetical protein IPP94_05210 [Ignavibacteria bacterium]|nr:hypothetical protein [Ignavibacteria bacterium]
MLVQPPFRASFRAAALFTLACVAFSPQLRSQHWTVGPWYIAHDQLWNEEEVFDSHSDGAGGIYTVYKNSQIFPGNVSQIRLSRPPSSDVDILNIPNLTDPCFRVVDQGPQRAWIGRLDMKAGRARVLLHAFDLLGKEYYHQGGLLLSGTTSAISFVLRRAPDAGVYACWWDDSTPIVQLVDKDGTPQWGADGLAIPTHGPAGSAVSAMDIVSTPEGGLIAAWVEHAPAGGDRLLCAQRINHDGSLSWAGNAVLVDRAPGDIALHAVIADAEGGAFLHWQRDSVLLLQHLDAAGSPLLDPGSIAMGSPRDSLRVKGDGKGGILISNRISVRRVATDHSEPWTGQAVIFTAEPAPGTLADATPDGKGGAFVVWNAKSWITLVQWIDSTGMRRWEDGIILLSLSNNTLTVCPSPPHASPTSMIVLDSKGSFGIGYRHLFSFVDTLSMATTTAERALAAETASLAVSPSPVRDIATVRLVLDGPSPVRLDVVDLLGRRERTLVESDLPSGTHAVNANFSALPCGTHFLVLRTATGTVARRFEVVR